MAANRRKIEPHWPAWYFPEAPFGSAVRYISALCPWITFANIGFSDKKAKHLEVELGTASAAPVSQFDFNCLTERGKVIAARLKLQTDRNIPLGFEIETKIRSVLNELSSIEFSRTALQTSKAVGKKK